MNSGSPPDQPHLFIDRDAWSRALSSALTYAEIPHTGHGVLFLPDSPDVDWIAAISDQGWIGITRDKHIRRRVNEIAAIRRSNAVVAVFTSGNLRAAETGAILVDAYPRIVAHIARNKHRPLLLSIHKDGSVAELSLSE